nr:PREDICTED: cGMP-dependent 3',5'-cyclic phosphodiesterase-like [Bemisia tabaci]
MLEPRNSSDFRLEANDPLELLQLVSSLNDDSYRRIQVKINDYIKQRTGASLVFCIPLVKCSEEAVVSVIGDEVLPKEVRFSVSENMILQTINKRLSMTLKCSLLSVEMRKLLFSAFKKGKRKRVSETEDEANEELSEASNIIEDTVFEASGLPEELLNVPVANLHDNNIALVCSIAHSKHSIEVTTKIVQECFRYCLSLVLSTLNYEEEKRLRIQCQQLLQVAKNLFSNLGDLDDLLKEIIIEARRLTNAERCSLFLLKDDYLISKVFDGVASPQGNKEVKIRKNVGVAGHVATSGKLINIRRAYDHPLFYKGVDEITGFTTKNILCFPIIHNEKVIGVAELCNKKDGYHFDLCDEEVATAFSIYCGITIEHATGYKKTQLAQDRNRLSNELMMYHMKVPHEAVENILNNSLVDIRKDFNEFSFNPRSIDYSETPFYCLLIFDNMDFIEHFKINRETLVRFFLYVMKGYRDPPYHNWMHAFSSVHFAYLCLKKFNLINIGHFTMLEGLAYVVAAMCHDIDHRGTTNSFQTKTNSTLAHLYSSEGSVMERHHLSQTMCILNTDGCNFAADLNHKDYELFLKLISQFILATDLSNHFNVLGKQEKMSKEGFNPASSEHRELLRSHFMTLADLSDQTKDWLTVKNASLLVYQEFFLQGDEEKAIGSKPDVSMDREKARIPELQLQFLRSVILPLVNVTVILYPTVGSILLDTVKLNLTCWERTVEIFSRKLSEGSTNIEILRDPEIEEYVLSKVGRFTVYCSISS